MRAAQAAAGAIMAPRLQRASKGFTTKQRDRRAHCPHPLPAFAYSPRPQTDLDALAQGMLDADGVELGYTDIFEAVNDTAIAVVSRIAADPTKAIFGEAGKPWLLREAGHALPCAAAAGAAPLSGPDQLACAHACLALTYMEGSEPARLTHANRRRFATQPRWFAPPRASHRP